MVIVNCVVLFCTKTCQKKLYLSKAKLVMKSCSQYKILAVTLEIPQIWEKCHVGWYCSLPRLLFCKSCPTSFFGPCLIQSRHLRAKSKVDFRSQSNNKIKSWLSQVGNYLASADNQTVFKIIWTNDKIAAGGFWLTLNFLKSSYIATTSILHQIWFCKKEILNISTWSMR